MCNTLTSKSFFQVVCKEPEKICTSDADGSLSCSFAGVCMGAAPAPAAQAAPVVSPTASIVPTLSLNGPSSITVPANQVCYHLLCGRAPVPDLLLCFFHALLLHYHTGSNVLSY